MSQVGEDAAPKSSQEAAEPGTNSSNNELPKDPFASKSSQMLFDAIDQLQSCDASQDIDIPQLVIVGGQSAGKSSLLQSLTSIPFPVSHGLCTRFATRIISRRTPPRSKDEVVITIVKPDFELDHIFNYSNDSSYEKYMYRAERLDSQMFAELMEEVTEEYMGIKPGRQPGDKNFATEVLKIELSGPQRAHFSILDIPGLISNDMRVHTSEMHGIGSMIVEYMSKPQNIVICVSEATIDLDSSPIFHKALEHVDSSRLIPVFTKCDMAAKPESVVGIATGENINYRPMEHGWFVVRNRTDEEDASFDLDEAEAALFDEAPWGRIPGNRRGSAKLRGYLGGLLCERIRDEFPAMQHKVKMLLGRELQIKASLGEPRDDHKSRLQYLMGIVQVYKTDALQALHQPWHLPEEAMRLRSIVSNSNRDFDNAMMSDGHTYEFEELHLDYPKAAPSPASSLHGFPPTPEGSPQPKSKRHSSKMTGPGQTPSRLGNNLAQSPAELRTEIRKQIYNFQSSQLPGLLNPDIFPVLYRIQTKKWESIACQHLELVVQATRDAALGLLSYVFFQQLKTGDREKNQNATHDKLVDVLMHMSRASEQRALESLRRYCSEEITFPFFTTNPEFTRRLEENRLTRFKNHSFQHFKMLFEITEAERATKEDHSVDVNLFDANLDIMYARMHPSTAQHTEDEAHDILKAYYELSLRTFIEHVTKRIVEDMMSSKDGPLLGLSPDYLMSLSEAEIEEVAREDEGAQARRKQCLARMARLTEANRIAENALRDTRPRSAETVA
ncbi:uncharacterized protein PG998_005197 [Apiospora kogelbergensis]|uniref:uncharacterized protein n=1 Tax=Apiospora kogelbergensis TaxID=1337665 RepID=UPI0031322AB6